MARKKYKRPSLAERFKGYIQIVKPMTFKQKIEYTWEYYKWILIATVIIAFMVIGFWQISKERNREYMVTGVGINTTATLDGIDYLSDNFYKKNKKKLSGDTAEFTTVELYDKGTTEAIEASYDTIMGIVARASNNEIDYIVADEAVGFQYCLTQDLLLDLNEFLTKDELAYWKENNKLIYGQVEGSEEPIPVAIDITETDFCKTFFNNKQFYFSVIAGGEHVDNVHLLLKHITDYKN